MISAIAISMACSLVNAAALSAPATTRVASVAAAAPTEEWRTHMITEWTRAKAYTKEYLDAMPEDGLGFKPTPDIRSFAEQMLHFTAANFLFANLATGVANPYNGKNLEKMDEYKKSKAALSAIVMESYDFVISSIKKMDLSKGGEEIDLFGRFKATRAVTIEKAFEHQTHHRGQTTIYLRLKGVTPPAEKLF